MFDVPFYEDYASVKQRGLDERVTFRLTHHKCPVRAKGFVAEETDEEKALREYIKEHFTIDAPESSSIADERFKQSIIRSKSNVIQYGENNRWQFFGTLTLSSKRFGKECGSERLVEVSKYVRQSFRNYQKKNPDFKYLLIPEIGKKGRLHFHCLLMGISTKDIFRSSYRIKPKKHTKKTKGKKARLVRTMKWKFFEKNLGITDIQPIGNVTACSRYITKYISKDMFGGSLVPPGGHLYYCSQGLSKDTVVAVGILRQEIPFDSPEVDFAFENEYVKLFTSNKDIFSSFVAPLPKLGGFSLPPKDLDFERRYAELNYILSLIENSRTPRSEIVSCSSTQPKTLYENLTFFGFGFHEKAE
ncbi:hypothetical protein FACS1894188_01150 [Clostridia bacterium]|nr:hypothetical protein FACS1894188_01150 [Clostridia bacterium]